MRRTLTLFLAAALSITPAYANDGPCSENLPPAQYASMPAPAFELIRVDSQSELRQACGQLFRILACALQDQPIIYMATDRAIADVAGDVHRGRRWKQCLIAHEIAHLNGWRH